MAATARGDVARLGDQGSLLSRLTAAGLAAWGAFLGIAPHVLHHAGPLAGAAMLAGASGQLLFFGLGLLASVPLLRRLHRRFRSWIAPATALALFVATFAFSALIVGPAITGSDAPAKPGIEQPTGHVSHHSP